MTERNRERVGNIPNFVAYLCYSLTIVWEKSTELLELFTMQNKKAFNVAHCVK